MVKDIGQRDTHKQVLFLCPSFLPYRNSKQSIDFLFSLGVGTTSDQLVTPFKRFPNCIENFSWR
jgi:hypothetical protein